MHMDQKRKTVLCIGTVVLDIMVRPVPDYADWKEKQRIEQILLQSGGDAANQSVHLAALGLNAMLNGCVGQDENGEAVRAALMSRGTDVTYLRRKEGLTTGTSLVAVGPDGERHIFTAAGAQGTLEKADLPETLPADLAAISIGSLFSIPKAEQEGLPQLLQQAKAGNIPVFADLDSVRAEPDCRRVLDLLPLVDYFLPSSYDLPALTRKGTIQEAAEYLRSVGVRNLIVKCGEKGCEIYSGSFCGTVPSIRVNSVDQTGAGDCMVAAFISRILEGERIESAVRYGCAAGALCTLWTGAAGGILTDRRIREMMGAG